MTGLGIQRRWRCVTAKGLRGRREVFDRLGSSSDPNVINTKGREGARARANVDDTNSSTPPPPPPPPSSSRLRVYPRVRAALCSDKYTADAGVVSIRETQATWGHLSRYDREYIQETRSRNSSLEIFNKYVVQWNDYTLASENTLK